MKTNVCLSLFLLIVLSLSNPVRAQARMDTVRIDFSVLNRDVGLADGWSFDAAERTLTILGMEGAGDVSPVYLLFGDGSEKVEHVLLDAPGDSLSVVMGSPDLAWACEKGYPLEVTADTRVGMRLMEGSLTHLSQMDTFAGAAVYNRGVVSVFGTGELAVASMGGAAFYNEDGWCRVESGTVYLYGGVALYLEGASSFGLGDEAMVRINGDVGVYSNAHLDVRAGSFVVYGFKEQLSTAVIEGADATVSGSLLQFTSTEEARLGGVTLELRSENDTVPVFLEENMISFAQNIAPGSYQLIKPGSPDIVEQGVNEEGETVTFFEARANSLTNYIEVEPATVTSSKALSVEAGVAVFSSGDNLVVRLGQPETIRVYTANGVMVKALSSQAGDRMIELPEGIYFLRVGKNVYKVRK